MKLLLKTSRKYTTNMHDVNRLIRIRGYVVSSLFLVSAEQELIRLRDYNHKAEERAIYEYTVWTLTDTEYMLILSRYI